LPDFFWRGGTPERSGVLPFLQGFFEKSGAQSLVFCGQSVVKRMVKDGFRNAVFQGRKFCKFSKFIFGRRNLHVCHNTA
jgi:hypothetical protein